MSGGEVDILVDRLSGRTVSNDGARDPIEMRARHEVQPTVITHLPLQQDRAVTSARSTVRSSSYHGVSRCLQRAACFVGDLVGHL